MLCSCGVVLCMQAGELERVEKEINLSLQGIGLSLVNDRQRREIAYMAISRLASLMLSCCLHTHRLEKTALDRGQTNCINLTHDIDIDLWPWPLIPFELWSWPAHLQMFKANGQSVPKIEWNKWTIGQSDGQTEGGDCITCRIYAVRKKISIRR